MDGLKSLDLFSGIGGFALAAERAGIETAIFCEIDKFPQSVLKYRYPDIPLIDDVRKLTKETFKSATGLDYVDIVCGGSPCQNLSVAGKREGLRGSESGLFYEYARIVNELKPKCAVWENVPGALSSNGGRDFETVLCAFTGHDGIAPVGGTRDTSKDGTDSTTSPIGFSIRGFSESRSAAEESFLSQVLETTVAPKYYLSKRACEGILRRAKARNKTLPPLLKEALEDTLKTP